VYAYQLRPPQPDKRLGAVKALIREAHSTARRGSRAWAARMVAESAITHILIISDSPSRRRGVNRALEAELQRLDVDFFVTEAARLQSESSSAGAADR